MAASNKQNLQLDWGTIALYATLVLFGWLSIYSAAYNPLMPSPFSFSEEYGKQLVWIGVCTFLIVVILYLDAEVFNKLAVFIYLFFVLLLMLVLFVLS